MYKLYLERYITTEPLSRIYETLKSFVYPALFYFAEGGAKARAKGKYQEWLEPEKLILIEGWARDGLTDEQIAANIGICRDTLIEWKKKYSDISDALKRGKEVVDIQVENALLKRALGYSYNEDKYISVPMDEVEYFEKLEKYMNMYKYNHPDATDDELFLVRERFPKTKEQLIERKVKEVAPDTTAQIFWLKNRKPEKWRDKRVVDDNGAEKSMELIQNMQTIADILQHPAGNRSIDDFERTRGEEVQDNE